MVKELTLPKILQPYEVWDKMIRLGKDNDGGYLVNEKDVMQTDFLFSFGVGTDLSFEKDFVKKRWPWNPGNAAVAAFDGTIDNPDLEFFQDNKKFYKKNISDKTEENTAHLGTMLGMPGRLFIKCDIDGGEYGILDTLAAYSQRFTGMVIEFHDVAKYENFNLLTDFISRMKLHLAHVHINNYSYYDIDGKITPNVLELTFSSAPYGWLNRNLTLPHKLDMPNNPDGEDFLVRF